MKRKYILFGIGIIAVLITMIVLDMQKVKREEIPPLPTVTVGEKNVPAVYQSFTWHNGNNQKNKTNPEKTIVEPFNDLNVQFSDEEKPDELAIEVINVLPDMFPYLDSTVIDNRMKLPTFPATLQLSIYAKWKDKGEAIYLVEVEIEEQTSYQRWLSPSDDGYGVFIMEPESEEPYSSRIPPHIGQKILMMGSIGGQTLEEVQIEYPELNVSSLPTFIVLDNEKVILNTTSKDEFISFFESELGTAYENLIPETDNTIATLSIVDDNDLFHEIHQRLSPYFGETSPIYRINHVFHENDGFQEFYPELGIDKTPVYFVLDHKGVAYKTHDFEDFFEYLEGVFEK